MCEMNIKQNKADRLKLADDTDIETYCNFYSIYSGRRRNNHKHQQPAT
jgi:phage terminase small subunit